MLKNNLDLKYENNPIMQKFIMCRGDIYCVLDLLKKLNLYDYSFTLEEIGDVLHITRERVRQIEQSAIKKLKHPKIGRILIIYTR